MDWKERVVLNPEVLVGKPVVRGTRLAVEFLLELMSEGWTNDEILRNYPGLTRADLQAVLAYACEVLKSEKVYPVPAGEG